MSIALEQKIMFASCTRRDVAFSWKGKLKCIFCFDFIPNWNTVCKKCAVVKIKWNNCFPQNAFPHSFHGVWEWHRSADDKLYCCFLWKWNIFMSIFFVCMLALFQTQTGQAWSHNKHIPQKPGHNLCLKRPQHALQAVYCLRVCINPQPGGGGADCSWSTPFNFFSLGQFLIL